LFAVGCSSIAAGEFRPVRRTTNYLLLGFFCASPDDGALADLEERFLGALDDETCVLHFLYFSDYPAIRDDLIVDLQLRDQILKLLPLLLLRKDNKEVKDAEYQEERQKGPNKTPAAAGILKIH
jgi:hypothetical protein